MIQDNPDWRNVIEFAARVLKTPAFRWQAAALFSKAAETRRATSRPCSRRPIAAAVRAALSGVA